MSATPVRIQIQMNLGSSRCPRDAQARTCIHMNLGSCGRDGRGGTVIHMNLGSCGRDGRGGTARSRRHTLSLSQRNENVSKRALVVRPAPKHRTVFRVHPRHENGRKPRNSGPPIPLSSHRSYDNGGGDTSRASPLGVGKAVFVREAGGVKRRVSRARARSRARRCAVSFARAIALLSALSMVAGESPPRAVSM